MSSRFYRKVRVLAVGALVISALAAGPALAGGRTTTTATCGVSPDVVTNSSPFYVVGTGFLPGIVINAYIKDKVSKWIANGALYGGTVAADGTVSLGPLPSAVYYPSDLGTKYVTLVNASNPKRALCACTFSVQ